MEMFEQHLGRSVTIDQAAALLQVSRRTIYNRIREGKLQTIRTIGGSQRVLVSSLDENRKPDGHRDRDARYRHAGIESGTFASSRRQRPQCNRRIVTIVSRRSALMALLSKGRVGMRRCRRSRSVRHLRSALGAGAPLSTACANMSRRNRRRPSTSSSTASPDEVRAHRRAPRPAHQENAARRRRAAGERGGSRSALRRCRSSVARRRGDVVHVGRRTPRPAPTRCRPGSRAFAEFTGAGIGIALHRLGRLDRPPLARRPRRVFEGFRRRRRQGQAAKRSSEDPYGHGTHIGAIIAGSSPYPQDSTYQTPFRGVAPGANLISLRVIGADGTGKASDVIDAIHWVIRNRKRFNIRVINLSLGGAGRAVVPDDPMCEAVERAVHAGIVVVAAAGNRGKDAEGRSVHGLIESPGIDPYVITVGALNTKGTARRSDDELATYSSKGPTLVDGFLKPDIAAPGNKIVSAEALGASLIAEHPDAARVGVWRGRVCDAERDEHGDGRGERRGGAGARGEPKG